MDSWLTTPSNLTAISKRLRNRLIAVKLGKPCFFGLFTRYLGMPVVERIVRHQPDSVRRVNWHRSSCPSLPLSIFSLIVRFWFPSLFFGGEFSNERRHL